MHGFSLQTSPNQGEASGLDMARASTDQCSEWIRHKTEQVDVELTGRSVRLTALKAMLAYVGYVNGFTHLKCALEKMDRNTTSSKRRIRKERECWVGNAWRCLGTFCGVFARVSSTTTYICTNSFPANGRRGGTPQQRAGRCTREVGPDTGGYQAFKSLCWRGTVPVQSQMHNLCTLYNCSNMQLHL